MIPPCAVTFVRVHCRIFIHTLLTMAICMQDDSAVLCALLRLRGKVKVLKLEKKPSMKQPQLLMGFGNKPSVTKLELTFVVGRSSRVDTTVQAISAEFRSPELAKS